jgi:hypothetical protein
MQRINLLSAVLLASMQQCQNEEQTAGIMITAQPPRQRHDDVMTFGLSPPPISIDFPPTP